MNALIDTLPSGVVHLNRVQPCRDRLKHRYLIASGDHTLYVAFMGTKQFRDILTDAGVAHKSLSWAHQGNIFPSEISLEKGFQSEHGNPLMSGGPAAHGGYLSRSKGIPVETLYYHARLMGKKIVFCGYAAH